ncbi:tail fiber domain-containing protein [Enterobacter hormaechei]|uniref:tail fiber domain-containing protein n=2 Tax=Enterobacter hormaechei TaxID=158836 RepID=UPI0018ED9F3F|nr:tail fiber domain-containing protein [Enterobacter hormaechei]MBJ6427613.1 tail fiber domain-containing protein [Enterobacter hormaechei]MBK4328362.1 tail fiber domain-containing protein [Enterobacter hormaechei]MBK4376333.1 tail fiber domain-containing protein [Enterobacter hormaechei]MBK4536358.1 tail fiber domain-containing protein [Enterobacter hormaechei]MBK4558342.1 tail fiber domain-containing protein [Enterobacter hormaechei]
MLYNTGTIAINGNTATGTGTNWTAPASQIRVGQTLFVLSNPVQMFQITAINSATSLTVTPAASPALSGQKYGILVSDIISVDGLAQAMSQLIKEYDENIGAWETFATTSANQNITVTINGARVTIPASGKLVQKRSNGAVGVSDGGTGATDADIARTNLYAAKSGENEDITLIRGLKGRAQLWTDTDYSTGTLVSYTGTTVGAIVRATTSIVATSTYAASASFGYWIDANSIGSSGPALASTGSQQNRWLFRNSSGVISTANGDITPSASDERVKNIIREITEEEAVNFISGLKPIRYTFKWAPEKIKVGYSAQNIETLDSELISVSALTVIDPVSGESKTFEDGKIIDPGEVGAAYLVPVVKQLLRRLDDLENAMRN